MPIDKRTEYYCQKIREIEKGLTALDDRISAAQVLIGTQGWYKCTNIPANPAYEKEYPALTSASKHSKVRT